MSTPEFEDKTTTFSIPLPATPQTFAGGRYQVKKLLGEGGQKYVFLARDVSLDRDVVISFLKAGGGDASSNARLLREAGALGRLGDHPNIVTIYDIGDEAGRPYIVCQYVQGGTVTELLNGREGRRLTLEEAIQIALQVCHALDHSHRAGIVHRDLKPSNIWLTEQGSVKLGDFGLALRMDSSRSIEGKLVGTAAYISPEQGEGRPAGPASDLYALGIVLYEMLTGRPPFLGDHMLGILWQHINTPPVAPSWHNSEIPAQVESLILRLLAKSPAERPLDAAEVAETLAAIAGSKPAMAERVVQSATSLSRIASGIFVGREAELRQLQSALHEALGGHGSLRMLVGEPGSGKTRTAEQLMTYARLHDFQILQGRCYEGEGAPAFWPWVQVIRSYLDASNSGELFANRSGAAAIAEIVPEVRGQMEMLEALPPLEPSQARFRLFESVTTFLKSASRAKPLLVVLDDLHWADAPSLLLLVFLAREFQSSRMLVVGTFRDISLARHHPLARALGDLARLDAFGRIPLGGLSEADVARFIETSTRTTPSPALVKSVYARTEGNPFFVSETIKLLISEGRLRSKGEAGSTSVVLTPQSVREVIGRRLDHLSEDCNKALAMASVLGSEFSVSVLQRVSDLPAERLLDVLEEAVAARVVNELPRVAGQFAFSHALIREVLYEELGVNLRVRLHRRAGAVLEEMHAFELDEHLDQLANHFLRGAAGGDVDKAIGYAIRAGRRASNRTAYEEAAAHYERALGVLETRPQDHQNRRGELLLALGDALKKAGEIGRAYEILERAADCARKTAQWESLARVALTRATVTGAIGVVDEAQLRLLNEALDRLPPQDSALRASVLAQLSAALYYAPDRRVPLSLEAVEMARRVGDPIALITALYCRHMALVLTDDLEERRQVALEMLHIAEAAGSKETMLRAWYRLVVDAMEMGDMRAHDEAIENYARLAEGLRQPSYLWLVPFFRGNKAVLQGRFEECERLAREAWAIANRVEDRVAMLFLASQTTLLRVEQGRAEEQLQQVEGYIQKYPMVPGYRATLAYVYAHVGRLEDARRELEHVTADNLASLPRDGSWIVVLASLAWVCWTVGHAELAEVIYPLLLPYAGRNIVTGNAGVGCGSVWRGLGLLSASMSRWDQAVHQLEEAIQMNARMGARPMEAGAKYELAQVLRARGAPGDRERAMRLVDEALVVATDIGAAGLLRRIHLTNARE